MKTFRSFRRGSSPKLQICFFEHAQTTNKGHGRIEVRECWSTSNPEYLNLIRNVQNWTGLKRQAGLTQSVHYAKLLSALHC
jgi:hypothetical protein